MRASRPPTSKPSFNSLAGLSAPVISSRGALLIDLTSVTLTGEGVGAFAATSTFVRVFALADNARAAATDRAATAE